MSQHKKIFRNEYVEQAVDSHTTLFWFRRDLRLYDNAGLYYALKENTGVLSLFIFDTEILDKLDDATDARVTFIHQSLARLKQELEKRGSSLLVLHGNPVEIFKSLTPKAVYTNHDYEPYARSRDEQISKLLANRNIAFKTFKDQVIFEKDEILKDDHTPYTVFTPYSKKWKTTCTNFYLKAYPVDRYISNLKPLPPLPFPQLADIGFSPSHIPLPERKIPVSIIQQYDKTRDYPGINGTSRLSVHLRFGTVSIRQLAKLAFEKNEKWLNELIWREFYQMILYHFPHVTTQAFKPEYDRIVWRNNSDEFQAWCEGRTGYPLVDAGMRELNATGYMHNRVRMVTASFLTKNLLIDWRWGEAYFAKKLLDFELASNNGGWQWSAGSGCDGAPYFRIFNPELQAKKFDPQLTYIKKWIPELDTPQYPKPIVDFSASRHRALQVYGAALGRNLQAQE